MLIKRTYGHLLPDAAEFTRGQLDAFDAAENRTFGQQMGSAEKRPAPLSVTRKGPLAGPFLDRGAEI